MIIKIVKYYSLKFTKCGNFCFFPPNKFVLSLALSFARSLDIYTCYIGCLVLSSCINVGLRGECYAESFRGILEVFFGETSSGGNGSEILMMEDIASI